ncbi:MAG: HEAT repeat domain-containing protein [Planctomycetota bacterium]
MACGCGGDEKKSGKKISMDDSEDGDTPSKKPSKKPAKQPDKPAPAKSSSGKTAHELVQALASSYTEVEYPDAEEMARLGVKRRKIVAELIEIGSNGRDKVLEGLQAPIGAETHEWLILALGEIGDAKSAEALTKIALSNDWQMAICACDALGRLKDSAGVAAKLTPLLTVDTKNEWPYAQTLRGLLRNAAAEAVSRLGSQDGVPVLIANLEGGAEIRRDALVRLRRVTAKSFGMTVDGPADKRAKGIGEWKRWWDSTKGLFKPAPSEQASNHAVFSGKQ